MDLSPPKGSSLPSGVDGRIEPFYSKEDLWLAIKSGKAAGQQFQGGYSPLS